MTVDRHPPLRDPAVKTAVAIRHVAFEGVGGFAAPLAAAGYELHYVDAVEQLTHDAEKADLLIVLGGPIGADADDLYPFLKPELALIERRLVAGRPMMGICLGAQLIARAAGAALHPGRARELGFAPISLTTAGAASCLARFTDDPITLHWHADTFDLPAGAERLASTAICENQAFALGRNVIGFQFHPEATCLDIEHWLVGHAVELADAGIDVPHLRAQAAQHAENLARKAEATATVWLEGIETPRQRP